MSFRQLVLIAAIPLVLSPTGEAQLFGERTIGRETGRLIPTAADSVGSLDGPRRFMRGMRAADDFVGVDRGDTAAFVGANQVVTSGNVESTVTGLTEPSAPWVNRPRTVSAAGLYPERLSISFEPLPVQGAPAAVISQDTLSITARQQLRIAVSSDARFATIDGTVATEDERRIAELLVLFEPGIETVSNRIRVQPVQGQSKEDQKHRSRLKVPPLRSTR